MFLIFSRKKALSFQVVKFPSGFGRNILCVNENLSFSEFLNFLSFSVLNFRIICLNRYYAYFIKHCLGYILHVQYLVFSIQSEFLGYVHKLNISSKKC